jgi:hypothetical protein
MASKFGFISLAVLLSIALQSARSQDAADLCNQIFLVECLAPIQMEYSGLEFEDLIAKMKKEGLSGDCKRAKAFLKCSGKVLNNNTTDCSEMPAPLVTILQDVLTKEERAVKYVCDDQFNTMDKINTCLLDNFFGTVMALNACIEPDVYETLEPCQQISKAVNCLVETVKNLCKTSDQETGVARTAFQNFVAPVNGLAGCQQFLKTRHVQSFMNFILKR